MINKVVVQYGAGATFGLSVQTTTIEGFTPVFTSAPEIGSDFTLGPGYIIPSGGQGTFLLGTQPQATSELFFALNLGGNCHYVNVIFTATTEGALSYSATSSPIPEGLPGVNVVQMDDYYAIEVGAYTGKANPSTLIPDS